MQMQSALSLMETANVMLLQAMTSPSQEAKARARESVERVNALIHSINDMARRL